MKALTLIGSIKQYSNVNDFPPSDTAELTEENLKVRHF